MSSPVSISNNPISIAKSLIAQYYNLLLHSPTNLLRFYYESSQFLHSNNYDEQGITGLENIKNTLSRLDYTNCQIHISGKDISAQLSINGGIFISVSGFIVYNTPNKTPRLFSHTILVQHDSENVNKMYIFNDCFRILENFHLDHLIPSMESNIPNTKQSAPIQTAEEQKNDHLSRTSENLPSNTKTLQPHDKLPFKQQRNPPSASTYQRNVSQQSKRKTSGGALFVRNFPSSAKESDLHVLFSTFHGFSRVYVNTARGFAFVDFDTEKAVEDALALIKKNPLFMEENRLFVDIRRETTQKPGTRKDTKERTK